MSKGSIYQFQTRELHASASIHADQIGEVWVLPDRVTVNTSAYLVVRLGAGVRVRLQSLFESGGHAPQGAEIDWTQVDVDLFLTAAQVGELRARLDLAMKREGPTSDLPPMDRETAAEAEYRSEEAAGG